MSKEKHFWAYNFDLVEKQLKRYYGKKSISSAYREVGNYLMAHGFDNQIQKQGSGYFTTKEYTAQQAEVIIANMYEELPWLPFCVRQHKEALTIKSELEYSHTKLINRLMKNTEHLKRLNQYYDSVGAPDKKIPFPSKTSDKTSSRKSSDDKQKSETGKKAGNESTKSSLLARLKNTVQSAHKENKEHPDIDKTNTRNKKQQL